MQIVLDLAREQEMMDAQADETVVEDADQDAPTMHRVFYPVQVCITIGSHIS